MAIITISNDLFYLCLMKTDTASEPTPMNALNMNPNILFLLLVVCLNFGNKIGISSKNIL